jgi:hypothetical protein
MADAIRYVLSARLPIGNPMSDHPQADRRFTAEEFQREIANCEAEITVIGIRPDLLKAALRMAAAVERPGVIERAWASAGPNQVGDAIREAIRKRAQPD